MARGYSGRKTEKEEITWSDIGINAGGTIGKTIVVAENDPTTAGEVEIGDGVKFIFFEVNFSAEVITSTKIIHWFVAKEPFGTAVTLPSTYDQISKRFILKRGMEMLPKDLGTVIKRIFVVKIPRPYQRMGDSDKIVFRYQASSSEAINCCGIAIYRHSG